MLVLQVEDNVGEAQLLAEAIRDAGVDISIELAPNGLRAIEHLHLAASGAHHVPDMILLDLNMPEMDGISFLRARAKLEAVSKIPVVVFVPSMKSPAVSQVTALGAKPMVKPESFDLYMALARRLSRFPTFDPTPIHGHPITK